MLNNNKIDRDKTYAILLQNEDRTGYIESTSNTFPNDMVLNEELTNCVDESGDKVINPFTYENGIITLRTSKKVYCYLYFDRYTIGDYLISNTTSGFNSNIEAGLYRYQGASGTVDNYICFGTSTKSTCTGDTDRYMYRIIGVNSSGQVKLIKTEALSSTMQWYSNYTTNITWPNSNLYKNINGNSFLTNETYMPSGWSDKIEITTWKYGDNSSYNVTASTMYNIESGWTSTVSAKIGLIYSHDYFYAYQSGGLNCSSSGSYSTCKNAWINLSKNDSGAPSTYEWTMSRFCLSAGAYYAYGVIGDGNLYGGLLNVNGSARPVFFLKSDVAFISGTGTSSDPFIIS